MVAKQVYSGVAARRNLLAGMALAARTAAVTIGPMGRYVLADRRYGVPILRDAVSAIRPLTLHDRLANLGVSLVRDVAVRTSDAAEDGTATASILFHALVAEGQRCLSSGADAGQLSRAIQRIAQLVIDRLHGNAVALDSDEAMLQLAASVAGGDEHAGRIAAEAVRAAGRGMVVARVGAQTDTMLEVGRGIRVDVKPICPELAPDMTGVESSIHHPIICLYDGTLAAFDALVPLLEASGQGRSLVVVADDIVGEARSGLILNKSKHVADIVALKPAQGARALGVCLADASAATGIAILGEGHAQSIDGVDVSSLATQVRIHFDRDSLIIHQNGKHRSSLDRHRRALINELAAASEGRKDLERRIANLEGQCAVIHVGGYTEIQAKETRDRIGAALHALKLAGKAGVVQGGGASLMHAIKSVRGQVGSESIDLLAFNCMERALAQPLSWIVRNSGRESGPVIETIRYSTSDTVFDVRSGMYVGYRSAGLFDPVATVAYGLDHASSLACLVINSNVFVAKSLEPSLQQEGKIA